MRPSCIFRQNAQQRRLAVTEMVNMTTDATPRISVVIPVFNEAQGLATTIATVQTEIASLAVTFELILVDDGSTDNTWAVIERLSHEFPTLCGIRLSRNFGKEAALTAGLNASLGDAVIVMDGDCQHPPSLIPEMIRVWSSGEADIVEAVKQHRGKESVISRARATMFYGVLRWMSGLNLEGMSDFKLLDRRVVKDWRKLEEHNRFFRGMVAWLGFRHVQIPFTVQDRNAGKSGWSVLKLTQLAIGAITSFSTFPLHFSSIAGVTFAILAVFLGGQTLYVKLSGQAVAGFTTVILLLLIIGSAVLLSIGVIGEYVARIYQEVKRRPPYLVSDQIDGRRQLRIDNRLGQGKADDNPHA